MTAKFLLKIFSLSIVMYVISACSTLQSASTGSRLPVDAHLLVRSSQLESRLGLIKVKWSPVDHNQLVLQGIKAAFSSPLYVADLNGAITPLVVDNSPISGYEPAWSPDGTHIALLDFDSGRIRTVRMEQPRRTEILLTISGHAVWSPDGRRLIVISLRDEKFNIHLYDVSGRDLGTLLEIPNERFRDNGVGGMAWSPDGKQIAFSMIRESDSRNYSQGDIFLFGLEGKSLVQVTATPAVYEDEPTWSPDGRLLMYTAHPAVPSADWQIVFANADGSCPQTVHDVIGVRSPSWSPDGTQIAVLSWEGDVYILNLASLGNDFTIGKLRCK
jgi:Tol biopolymer transport system component